MKCTTCNIPILSKKNFVRFLCPNCGKVEIIRCDTCKNLGNKYTCSACKFVGP